MATTERTRLSREAVAEGALALADDEGLDALTIRRLAQRLGVTPMALYWHFKNKGELLDGVVNLLWSKVDNSVDPTRPWLEQLRAIMESMVEVLRAHPSTAPLVMDTKPDDATACFDTMETALGILRGAGFSTRQAADICQHGLRTATTLAGGEPGFTWQQHGDELDEETRRKRLKLQSLPMSRYPHVIEAAEPLTDRTDPDAYYTFGIDMFIAGVEALVAHDR